MLNFSRWILTPAAIAAAATIAACAGTAPAGSTTTLTVESVPAPADMVSGGNALIRISSPDAASLAGVAVTVNGTDVTSTFRAAPADPFGRPSHALIGLVANLTEGDNRVAVTRGDAPAGELSVRNHSIKGPIFSGPHQAPFLCQTLDAGLGTATDDNCSAATKVTYLYKSTEPPPPPPAPGARGRGVAPAGRGRGAPPAAAPAPQPEVLPIGFKLFDPGGPRPADLAATTTTGGATVDYVVRRERGVINRAIYDIAFLHVPGQPLPDPWTDIPGWNRRLVYTFGGGCAAGYRQGPVQSAVLDAIISGGYAVAASSLNVFGTTCDDVISAETMMMVKEYFVERFGVPVYTIGNGGSGGSMQQHLIAQNYPGLLDGLTPGVSFSDGIAVWASSADCDLLARVLDDEGSRWTDEQKRAVSGFATWRVCGQTWARSNLERADNCANSFPDELDYHPVANPTGARCSTVDNMANSFGRDPATGWARRPLDNVGVQYGLAAYNAGAITAAQFLDLNARVGGHDADGNIVATRTVASAEALRAVYERGRINTGGGSLGAIPIIDWRGYTDPTADIHDSYRSFVTRARIAAANGGRADNHIILRTPGARGATRVAPPFNALRLMDQWLEALARDGSADPVPVKVVRSRPADLVDACWGPDGEKIAEPASYTGAGRCNTLYPPFGDPRIAAGAPLTDDVFKCELKPIDPNDYTRPLTAAQMSRLGTIFPGGVCDYSKPGVAQRVTSETWQRY